MFRKISLFVLMLSLTLSGFTPLNVRAVSEENPELTIIDIQKIPESVGETGVRINYRNAGPGNTDTWFEISLEENDGKVLTIYDETIVYKIAQPTGTEMNSGEERYLDFKFDSGTYNLTATVDASERISEDDEDNNTYTKTIIVGEEVSTDLEITLGTANFISDTAAQIYWTTNDVSAGCSMDYSINSDVSSAVGTNGLIIQSPTSSNGERYHYSVGLTGLKSNTDYYYKINCIILANEEIISSSIVKLAAFSDNANTNDDSSSSTNTNEKPELTIKDIQDIPSSIGKIGVRVIYRNAGPGRSKEGFRVRLEDVLNDYAGYKIVESGAEMNSGEERYFDFELSPGTYNLTATVDVDNFISESDESNNSYTKTKTVGSDNDESISNDNSDNSGSVSGLTYYNDRTVGSLPGGYNEWVVVNATTNGPPYPVASQSQYRGIIEVMMDGVIQASGTSQSDAYYILTDYDGNTVSPIPAKEFGLYVNGHRVADFWPQKYRKGSQYVFKANLGSNYQTVKFSIGDGYRADNSGSFKLAIKGDSREGNAIQDISTNDGGSNIQNQTNESTKVDRLILKLERTITQLENKVINLEKKLIKKIDKVLSTRLKGRILLQVENNGEAWYVDPSSENKFYMKDGEASYDIMRSLGLGISNANLEKIPIGIQDRIYTLTDADGDGLPDKLEEALGTDPNKADTDGDGFDDKAEILNDYNPNNFSKFVYSNALKERLAGRILLQVEGRGEAWYINPDDGRRYFLGTPTTAYNVMRFLSLGINNNDLRQIQVGEFEE